MEERWARRRKAVSPPLHSINFSTNSRICERFVNHDNLKSRHCRLPRRDLNRMLKFQRKRSTTFRSCRVHTLTKQQQRRNYFSHDTQILRRAKGKTLSADSRSVFIKNPLLRIEFNNTSSGKHSKALSSLCFSRVCCIVFNSIRCSQYGEL